MIKIKITSRQMYVMTRLAESGWDVVSGPDLQCARGLHRRKIPLVVVEYDAEGSSPEARDLRFAARLTDEGAELVGSWSDRKMRRHDDGSWTFDRNNESEVIVRLSVEGQARSRAKV